ncbi:MAG TPA: FAD:protein FMN transferase [Candidatus Rifleibacterium sp.]|nr:FAD:protein FMN transferase [Candidatus Rifleibacterium sp.]HPT47379.1 FAD:protein FMN transferase [Candidatus Rifleibacterium sp.]
MNNSNRIIVAMFLLLLGAAAFLQFRQNSQPPFYNESRLLMDTVISIRVWPDDSRPDNSRGAVDLAFAEFAAVERFASFHIADSELARLNKTGVSSLLASVSELLTLSHTYHQQTGGFFDPSFAVLQKAYGFYDGAGRLPDANELAELLAMNCGLEKVLHRQADHWQLASGSLIDLGGIAGGYAIERAKRVLRSSGCRAFLIDDAGDIWFEGRKPDGKPWKIAVRDPRDNGALAYVESTAPLAISTSGDYERFITVDGQKYGHIMNPFTGRPVDYYASVTVVASDAVTADALSTAIFAMPPEQAFAWADQHRLGVLFLSASGSVHLSAAGKAVFSQVRTP